MNLAIVTESNPLEITPDGVVRVGQTRVTLDTVIYAFLEGATAEEIVTQYPVLQLADVYLTIAYYLKHKTEVDAYLLERQHRANVIRQEVESLFNPIGIRDRLLARKNSKDNLQ
ncbi:DUF433 domain-containing protein [Spirulina sp. 06S082]|uniref:DUF433 domain-containing protein n=1 Tax=Spirulina sp. 06S082 TaxID=3110248 RepID=UPI002B1F6AE2|nr:DUF433 domain-containing protein [Spirulina sp. 06S082]MEA5468923.1 DUF433 domain-containing protein [Spirulina sp. 06S082]